MSRLIDADVMIEYLRKQLCDNCHEQKDWCDICDYAYLIDEMKKVPTVDPIKHGHWDNKQIGEDKSPYDAPYTIARCSVCRGKVFVLAEDYLVNYPYCPLCGAKMDEVTDGNDT